MGINRYARSSDVGDFAHQVASESVRLNEIADSSTYDKTKRVTYSPTEREAGPVQSADWLFLGFLTFTVSDCCCRVVTRLSKEVIMIDDSPRRCEWSSD